MSDLQSLVWVHSLLALALKSTLILGCTFIATLLLRKRGAALKHWLWAAAIGSCLLLPIAMTVVPQWLPGSIRYTVLEMTPDSLWQDPLAASIQPRAPATRPAAEVLATPAVEPPTIADAEQGRRSLRWMHYALVVWAAVSGLLLMLFALGLVRTWRTIRAGHQVVEPDWRSALQEAKDRAGVEAYVHLLESKETQVPLAAGFVRATILLPENARTWTHNERVQVLVHELAHIRRRDNLTQGIASVARCLLWFQPLIWIGARRMKLLREMAADDAVLHAGEEREEYGDVLVRVARRAKGLPVPAAAPMASRSGLKVRIRHLLAARARNPLSARAAASFGLLLAMAIAFVGTMGFNPSAAYSLQSQVSNPSLYPRTPLFEPGIPGEARMSYVEALSLADQHMPIHKGNWNTGDASFEDWASAPDDIREFARSDAAQRIAELVVAGASHKLGTTGYDTVRRPDDLVDVSIVRLGRAVLAAIYARAERGETLSAVQTLLALVRYWDDRARGNATTGMMMSSSMKLPLLRQIDELASGLSDAELQEVMRTVEILLDTGPSWGDTIRSEAMWAVWIAPFSNPFDLDDLTLAMEKATSAPERIALMRNCSLPVCQDSSFIMTGLINRWAETQAREYGVYIYMAYRLYRRQSGKAPSSMDDLLPLMNGRMPVDPRTGKAFSLSHHPAGTVVTRPRRSF